MKWALRYMIECSIISNYGVIVFQVENISQFKGIGADMVSVSMPRLKYFVPRLHLRHVAKLSGREISCRGTHFWPRHAYSLAI